MKNKILKIYKLVLMSFVLFALVSCNHDNMQSVLNKTDAPSTSIEKNYCNIECDAIVDYEVYNPRPQRKVKLDKFLICDHEVTQGEWQWVMGNVDKFVKSSKDGKGANYPMNNISWYDAVRFCNALSEKHGFEKCYTINGNNVTCDFTKSGYRLPTVAEWEYASCAGKSGKLLYSGAETPNDKNIGDYAWYEANSSKTAHEVRSKKPNAFGIYDMSGNVWEWCWDWFDSNYNETDNPRGPETGTHKPLRGGGYICASSYMKPRFCGVYLPSQQWEVLGLRVCRSAL